MELIEKLEILGAAAKFDASCSSSGSSRKGVAGGIGSGHSSGICHSWAADGRCISLLKVLFTNYCINDCAYCINRRSNDVKRATFTVDELVSFTMNFYKRNYIEGLFLSSGIIKNADFTMEKLIAVAKKLRNEENFHGYIHLKVIPGASDILIKEAGLYADRVSVNIELPSEKSLKLLTEKSKESIIKPMTDITGDIVENREERRKTKKLPLFAPAGQTTQLIVGATPETDRKIVKLTEAFYKKFSMKRVYYSAFVPVNSDNRLPVQIFLSEEENAETYTFHLVKSVIKYGSKAFSRFQDEKISRAMEFRKRVSKECDKILGILRFTELSNGVFYAPFEPDHNILPLITGHFYERLSGCCWMIHDIRRGIAVYHAEGKTENVEFVDEMTSHLNMADLLGKSENEEDFAKMWRGYFKIIAIETRTNPKLQRQFMPKRYWKYMTEKKNG